MTPDPPTPPEQTGLVLHRATGLVTLPHGSSPALSEIINRSLAHLRTSQSLATRHREPGEEREFEIAPGVMMRMCWIPPGEFLMGSPEDESGRSDAEIQHRVTITQGFWLGKYQVTQVQWEAVMGSNPSRFKGADLPVESVSRNQISGPGGFLENANRFSSAGERFSLPTEAQWEYACRAGTTTDLNNGKNLTSVEGMCPNLDEVAWYNSNSGGRTHPVGQKRPNAWGLYDMHGNLMECCADYHRKRTIRPIKDTHGPDSGCGGAIRGGAYLDIAVFCNGDVSGYSDPERAHSDVGFRPVHSSFS